ncbi:hypothetical protein ACHAXS_008048 [Conticribra weissflogii]
MFKVAVPLSTTTLNALKDVIHTHPDLGPIQRKHQRLFHMGRELKSGNRSLKALGVGKFSVFLIHLHSLAPKTFDLQSDDDDNDDDDDDDDDEIVAVHVGIRDENGRKAGKSSRDGDDDNHDDDDVVEIEEGSTNAKSHLERKRNKQRLSNQGGSENNNSSTTSTNSLDHGLRQTPKQDEKVVELLDSDSEDDEEDDDDDVEVVETVPPFRNKRRKVH